MHDWNKVVDDEFIPTVPPRVYEESLPVVSKPEPEATDQEISESGNGEEHSNNDAYSQQQYKE